MATFQELVAEWLPKCGNDPRRVTKKLNDRVATSTMQPAKEVSRDASRYEGFVADNDLLLKSEHNAEYEALLRIARQGEIVLDKTATESNRQGSLLKMFKLILAGLISKRLTKLGC